jgi:AraC-like DNA-binding protein
MSKETRKIRPNLGACIPIHDCFVANEDGVAFEMTEDISMATSELDSSSPHTHPFYEILFVKHTDGRHVIECSAYEGISGMAFLVCPGQAHHWENVTSVSGMLIYFNEAFLVDTTLSVNAIWELNLLREMGGAGVSPTAEELRQMDELVRLMYMEYRSRGVEYASAVRSYLNVFLIQLFRIYQREITGRWPHQRGSSLCENFQRLVQDHVKERQPVQFFADRLQVSMGYLNEQVKRHIGMTPGGFIKKAAIAEAKRLIANTNMSMGEIAATLGFNDGSYFCRLFKSDMGMSPMKFRQSCSFRNRHKPKPPDRRGKRG